MHNRRKHNCIILKDGVNDPGLAFDGKVGLGPFWTLVQVLLYNDVCTSPSAPPSPPSGTRVQLPLGIYTRMQMQDLIDNF
jgi:hypothetical protein